ncbi:MAG: hypothetical protein E7490_11005 [Ruminococcaceae bacterium]|nr:hypothetical protein [Oscillospiraceae bacterium]
MKELPTRKNIRLDSFDYRANALYFVTFCTKDKKPILWEYAELINIGYFNKIQNTTDYEYKNNLVGAFISRKSEISGKWSQSCGLLTDYEHKNNLVGATISRPQNPQNPQELQNLFQLSEYGKITEQAINNIPQIYKNTEIIKYCIMPDHVHLLIGINSDSNGCFIAENGEMYNDNGRLIVAPTDALKFKSLSVIISQTKRYISKQIGFSLWQKSFYDRIIRDKDELESVIKYIELNPYKYISD